MSRRSTTTKCASTGRQARHFEIPLLGRIAAGAPVESLTGTDRLDLADFAGHENVYALEVRGESMIDDHICSGDLVLVENTQQVHDGDIVVALVRGSETHAEAVLQRERYARALTACECEDGAHHGGALGTADSRACARGTAQVRLSGLHGRRLARRCLAAALEFLLGAQPILFGRTALIRHVLPKTDKQAGRFRPGQKYGWLRLVAMCLVHY